MKREDLAPRRTLGARRSRAGAWALLTTASVALASAAASCSLGLDESKIGLLPETGTSDDGGTTDGAVLDAKDSAPPPINPEGGVCTKDEDCKGTDGCVQAKCDVPRKACVFTICRQTACNSSACDVPSKTCAAPKPYKYRAAQFPVNAPIGCGGALARCFVAVYPFVFVGTASGVVAFAANDPQSAAPLAVPISGLGFVPVQMVASGSRVFFLGAAQGAGATSRLPIAWADVPPDPFADKIPVTTVLATYNRPPGEPLVLYPRANDTALLVTQAGGASFASVAIEPPLVEPFTLTSTPITFTAGDTPVAVSGTRLVMAQLNAAGATQFAFVAGAGTPAPTTSPDVPIPAATPGSGPFAFAQSADGALGWTYVSLTSAPPGPPPPAVRAAKVHFLVADGNANFDPAATAGLDVEVYGAAPAGTNSAGPIAMLDATTAMVLTSIPANPAQTNVQFVKRQPLGVVKNADNQPRRFPIALPVTQLAAAGSYGIGYVLAVDPAAPATPQVHVFDPACAP